MIDDDKKKFLELMTVCSSVYRQEADRPVLQVFWRLLEPYAVADVERAFTMHLRASKFFPTPAEIIALLDSGSRRLSADEAWAGTPRDESETVVWTEEMSAAFAIASGLLAEGDKIAARMAFKSAYERLCADAVAVGRPVVWIVELGWDKSLIEPALTKAVALGRISQAKADKLLPAPIEAGVIAGLLTGKVVDFPANNEHLRKRWAGLKQAIVNGNRKLDERKRQMREDADRERLSFEQRRQDMLDKVAVRLQGELH